MWYMELLIDTLTIDFTCLRVYVSKGMQLNLIDQYIYILIRLLFE